jgi:hypothetical protein
MFRACEPTFVVKPVDRLGLITAMRLMLFVLCDGA